MVQGSSGTVADGPAFADEQERVALPVSRLAPVAATREATETRNWRSGSRLVERVNRVSVGSAIRPVVRRSRRLSFGGRGRGGIPGTQRSSGISKIYNALKPAKLQR